MSEFELLSGASPIELGPGWTLRAPGFSGRGAFELAARGARRAPGSPDLGLLDDVVARLAMTERAVAVLDLEPEPATDPWRRGIGQEPPAIEFETPEPPEGFEQVILAVDEGSIVSWHIGETHVATDDRRGATAMRHYRVPARRVSPTPPGADRRGLFSVIARKVLKVLVFPITDFVVGEIGRGVARLWESGHAPYGVRTFEPGNFKAANVGAFGDPDWRRIAGGPALLFVHGTFSTAHGCFSRMNPQALAELGTRYGGRTFAFNHWTLSHDPRENVKWLIGQIPQGPALDVDIVCHSRGGLVARTLAHALDELGGAGRVRVGRIVFVATPNDGTRLAQADHMVNMLDRYTNVVQFLPDGPIEIVLEGVVTAVKTLAHAGLSHLPGLAAQDPGSRFLDWLREKDTAGTEYYALAADWEPNVGPLWDLVKQEIADRIMDGVFQNEKNDLVVPTLGVGQALRGKGFPVENARQFTFPPNAGVTHTSFFGDPSTADRLLEWLTPRGGS